MSHYYLHYGSLTCWRWRPYHVVLGDLGSRKLWSHTMCGWILGGVYIFLHYCVGSSVKSSTTSKMMSIGSSMAYAMFSALSFFNLNRCGIILLYVLNRFGTILWMSVRTCPVILLRRGVRDSGSITSSTWEIGERWIN